MHANDHHPNEAIDQEAFEQVMRDNLTPDAIAMIAAFLQVAAFQKSDDDRADDALKQVEWFSERLTALLGVEEHNRLMEELGL